MELQTCSDCTDWSVFESATTDLDEFSGTVKSYIGFCEDVYADNTLCTYNNNKPWFTAKLRQLRQAKEEAYRSGDRILYNQARNTLTKEIRVAKRSYTEKLEKKVFRQRPSISVEKSAGHHQLQETIRPYCGEQLTGQRPKCVLLQV